jgi:hypothetical protein
LISLRPQWCIMRFMTHQLHLTTILHNIKDLTWLKNFVSKLVNYRINVHVCANCSTSGWSKSGYYIDHTIWDSSLQEAKEKKKITIILCAQVRCDVRYSIRLIFCLSFEICKLRKKKSTCTNFQSKTKC